jgi:uncharacterized RDD family membrane protein YckC
VSAERPPGEEGPHRESESEPDAPVPPPPWRRDPPAEPTSPAESSWRPYPEDEEPVAAAAEPTDAPPPPWRTEPTEPDGEEAPPPWRRDAPAEPAGEEAPPPWRREPPAESSRRPYADDEEPTEAQAAFGDEPAPTAHEAFGTPKPEVDLPPEPEPAPIPEPDPIPEPVPPPPPAQPRTGSIGPPGYEGSSGGATTIPPGVTTPRSRAEPEPAPDRHVLAPWGRRAVAYVLDGIIVGVVTTLIIVLITAAAGGVGFLGGDATGYGALVVGFLFSTLIATAVALLYSPLWMVRTNGQTLGKQLMGIRVIRPGGQQIDFLYALLREVVVKTFLFAGLGGSLTFGLVWLLDCLWPLWDDENRALHDMIVNSRVVRA